MSIGTAMVLIAIGVFFYKQPKIFKVTAKWAGVAVGVAAISFGGWYGYHQHQSRSAKDYLANDGTHPNAPWLDFWPETPPEGDPCSYSDKDANLKEACDHLVAFLPIPDETPTAYLERMHAACLPAKIMEGWTMPDACSRLGFHPKQPWLDCQRVKAQNR